MHVSNADMTVRTVTRVFVCVQTHNCRPVLKEPGEWFLLLTARVVTVTINVHSMVCTHLPSSKSHSKQWDLFPSKPAWAYKVTLSTVVFPFPVEFWPAVGVAMLLYWEFHMSVCLKTSACLHLVEEWDLCTWCHEERRTRARSYETSKQTQAHIHKATPSQEQIFGTVRSGLIRKKIAKLNLCKYF